jgi:hypothetical protein
MASLSPSKPPTAPTDPKAALQGMEQPAVRWKAVAAIAAAFALLWVIAFGLRPWMGWWAVGVVAILTAVAAGFGIYIWRLTSKSRAIVDILKGATDEEGRKAALERLQSSGKAGDAMNALAQAQLLAKEDPQAAIRVLEGVDLEKAPAMVQDDVRANLGLMYLMLNRTQDARKLANDIRLDRQPQAKAKALYAAVIAESFARTGAPADAQKLLETFSADDASYGEVRPMLYRAEIYACMALKKRGRVRTAMEKLSAIDPNMLGAFVADPLNPTRRKHDELAKLATEVLMSSGAVPRPKMKMIR